MSKHTPEPWYAYQREHPVGYSFGICNSRPCGTLVDEDGSLHTDFPDWNPGTSELVARTYDSENAHANANRIVACVNACAGMDDPAAEITRLRDLLRTEQLECLGELGKVQGLEIVNKELRLRLAAWKAEAEAIREHDTMEREPDEDIEHWFARRDIARIKIKKARAATDAIEKTTLPPVDGCGA